jgi:hypothetical protein
MRSAIVLAGMLGAMLAPAAARADVSWSVQKIDDRPPFFDGQPLAAVSCPSAAFCAAAGSIGAQGRIATSTNPSGGPTTWQPADVPAESLSGIACPSTGLCVAVDQRGTIIASTAPSTATPAWHVVGTSPSGLPFAAVACPSSSLCVAVGESGLIMRSTSPATANSWSETDSGVDGTVEILGVTCPSATACVAVDNQGNAVSSGDSGASWTVHQIDGMVPLFAVACPDTSLCVAIDQQGNALTAASVAATTWKSTHVEPADYGPKAISCASESLCVLADNGGDVSVSTNPSAASPTWSGPVTAYPTTGESSLEGIACPSAALCVAVDATGNAVLSTDPTGGSATWSHGTIEGTTRLDPGSCPTTTLCVIPDRIGKVLTSTDPTGGVGAWTAKDIDGADQIFGLDCPRTSLCVGVDDHGNVLTSTDPADGAAATWTPADVDGGIPLYGVSCAAQPSLLCVAVDPTGGVVSSTNPTGGPSAWTRVQVGQSPAMYRVDCPTAGLCVAVDQSGDVVTSTNPTGSASAWTITNVDGTTPLYSIACHGTTLCLAGDSGGSVLATTDPAAAAWSAPVAFGAQRIFALACPAATYCIAGGTSGDVWSTSDPTGDVSAWTQVAATGDGFAALGAECAGPSLCLLSDYQSSIAVGAATAPTVATGTTSAVERTTATANGTVNPNGSTVSDCHFEYGTTTSYGASAPCAETVGSGTSAVAVHADLTDLAQGTTYHVRLDATTTGITGQGSDQTFTTSAVAPTVAVLAVSDEQGTTATLTGQVNPNGATVTGCDFDYGTTAAYGTSVPCSQTVGNGTADVSVTAALAGLTPDTTYDVRLSATNAGGTGTDIGTFSTAAIDTTITSGPDGPTNNPAPTFTFTAGPPAGATFLCSIDHASPSPCTTPLTVGPLPDGNHDITVRAVTPGGVQDPTPAQQTFTVDTVAPATTLAFAPAPGTQSIRVGSGDSFSGPVQMTPTATDPGPGSGVAETRCAVDPTTPPANFAALPPGCPSTIEGIGTHIVYVASRDAAGNTEAPTAHTVKILAVPETTITWGPSGPTWDSAPSFAFTSSIPGSTFRCRVDGGLFTASGLCSSPDQTAVLASGAHTFQVFAISPDGVVDPIPATRTFSVNAPESDSWECSVDPYLAVFAFSAHPSGCEMQSEGHCEVEDPTACTSIDARCPIGARCTMKLTTVFDNADQGAYWMIDAHPTADSPTGRGTLWGTTTGNCFYPIAPSAAHCEARNTTTLLGENDVLDYDCDAADFNDDGGYGSETHGPDSSRRLECFASLDIEPAAPLSLTVVGLGLGVFVPGAGTLTLGAAGPPRPAGDASAAARSRSAFATIRRRVSRAGVVSVMLRLSGAAARTYRRRHRLSATVRETFAPALGAQLKATRRVMLSAPTPSLASQCRTGRRRRTARACRTLRRRHL